jgi:hypothetical protein
MDENTTDDHKCSFCGKTSSDVDFFVTSKDDKVLICDRCVRACDAVTTEVVSSDLALYRIPGNQLPRETKKLRPITRLPKTWSIYEVNLYAAIPYVTACNPLNEKSEDFSIPKQLAHWMIRSDKIDDIEKLKEDIKNEITQHLRTALRYY